VEGAVDTVAGVEVVDTAAEGELADIVAEEEFAGIAVEEEVLVVEGFVVVGPVAAEE